MKNSLDIQFVSDIMCPWCVVGLGNLNKAIAELEDKVDVNITFQPFELNPTMPAEGQGFQEHIIEKYGITKEQSDQNRAAIQERGKELDFDFNFNDESRMRNSFDAHRLLHWANLEGKQAELKAALFKAHFTHNQDVSDYAVLSKIAASVDLDPSAAKGILESGQYKEEVKKLEQFWQQNGINSVPTVVINNKYAITGGQPAESFKQALEEIMASESSSEE
ncbi:DsbA family oxidoreductase [Marinomonas sp. GJ51-6]|uniref:DsbA family oxidoreductase n=1 Tax=Marinomonas sp. GJ51-6 TaxID=2992802 RepID=UPI002934725A|nr:DsbA family oxidoreductase [Marinomonas sp. GJ51-6]WOD09180.1 DsbA family oxidoreductase [Marinomonas sp. GJ51-6]